MHRRGLPSLPFLFTLTSVLWSSAPVAALPWHETLGALDGGHPHAARSMGDGPEAAYFNPALLLDALPGERLAFVGLGQALDVTLLARPAGADVTARIYDARRKLPDGSTARLDHRPLPTSMLEPRGFASPEMLTGAATFGLVRHAWQGRLAFGVHALLPLGAFQRQQQSFADEREQYFGNRLRFELLDDRLGSTAMAAGVGWRPLTSLALGAGVSMANVSQATSTLYVPDASDQSHSIVNTGVEVQTSWVPHLGLTWDALRWLRLVGTVHFAYESTIEAETDLKFWDYDYPPGQDSIAQRFASTWGYEPLRAAAGAVVRPEGAQWSAGGQVLWAQWSAYRDRHDEVPVDAWSDTLAVAVAGDWHTPQRRLGLDLLWTPSPVPPQQGRTNYVDGDRAGVAASWEERVTFLGQRWGLGLGVGVQRVLPRSERKSAAAADPVFDEFPDSVDLATGQPIADAVGFQSNNPGYPGYDSQGWLFTFGTSIRTLPAETK
jgi:hypothetical protein